MRGLRLCSPRCAASGGRDCCRPARLEGVPASARLVLTSAAVLVRLCRCWLGGSLVLLGCRGADLAGVLPLVLSLCRRFWVLFAPAAALLLRCCARSGLPSSLWLRSASAFGAAVAGVILVRFCCWCCLRCCRGGAAPAVVALPLRFGGSQGVTASGSADLLPVACCGLLLVFSGFYWCSFCFLRFSLFFSLFHVPILSASAPAARLPSVRLLCR